MKDSYSEALKKVIYCGGFKLNAIIIGVFDILIAAGFLAYLVIETTVDLHGVEQFGEAYETYALAVTCSVEALEDDGSIKNSQVYACGGCWEKVGNLTDEDGLSRAKECVERYSSGVYSACNESIGAAKVGDEQVTMTVFGCFLNYVKENDPEGTVQSYVARNNRLFGLSGFNLTLKQFEDRAKELEVNEFKQLMGLISFVICIFIFVAGWLLVLGTKKEKSGFLLGWLVIYFFYIVYNIIGISHGLMFEKVYWWSALQIVFLSFDFWSFSLVWLLRKQFIRESSFKI